VHAAVTADILLQVGGNGGVRYLNIQVRRRRACGRDTHLYRLAGKLRGFIAADIIIRIDGNSVIEAGDGGGVCAGIYTVRTPLGSIDTAKGRPVLVQRGRVGIPLEAYSSQIGRFRFYR